MISVIVPVYNAEKYLEKCINSILSQNVECEIILVDDGSKDNSLMVCNQFKQNFNNIKVFHQENAGAASARNFGLKNANGEFVYFLDSDDYIDDGFLSTMLEGIKDVDLVVVPMKIHRSQSNTELRTLNIKGKFDINNFDLLLKEMYFEGVFSSMFLNLEKSNFLVTEFELL